MHNQESALARRTDHDPSTFSLLGSLLHSDGDLRDFFLLHVANCDPAHPVEHPGVGNGKAVLALRLVCHITGRVVLPLQRRVHMFGMTQQQLWHLAQHNVHVTNLMLLPNEQQYWAVDKTGTLFSHGHCGYYGGPSFAMWQEPLLSACATQVCDR